MVQLGSKYDKSDPSKSPPESADMDGREAVFTECILFAQVPMPDAMHDKLGSFIDV